MMIGLLKKHASKIKWINYIFLVIIFAVNFLGLPELKYLYLAYVVFTLFTIVIFDFKTSIQVILSFTFIEGQGRILWGYAPWARLAFDGILTIATLLTFIQMRDFKISKLLPAPMLYLILLHFLWYVVQFFNLNSINFMATLAGTKIYIFPFFLLVFFRKNEDFFTTENLKSIGYLIFFLLLAESLLCLHQLKELEGFMLGISPHYSNAMRGDIFIQDKFRPFGTTQLPGAVSVYIFLSLGFLFIRNRISKRYLLSLSPLLMLLFVILIISQVRSALLKYAATLLGIFLVTFFTSKNRLALSFRIAVSGMIIVPLMLIYFFPVIEKFTYEYVNLQAGLQRWQGFENIDDVTSQRTGGQKALDIAIDKLTQFPMGVGPGMTGAAGSLSVDLVKSDPVFNKHTFWGNDNFYLSMVTEFGYGCIFYLIYILAIPFIFISYFFKLKRMNDLPRARILALSAVAICIILAGNWGAIGVSYNPESFFFWLWTAIGFNVYSLALKEADSTLQVVKV